MRRTISLLAVMLAMVVLIAMSAAPAFAGGHDGSGGNGPHCTNGGVLGGALLPCLLQGGLNLNLLGVQGG